MRPFVVAWALVLIAGCSGSDGSRPSTTLFGDTPQGPPPENAVVLPPYPQEKDLLEFAAGPTGSHRYFIDRQSILVGTDGIVRYAVIVRAAGGSVSATYEGIRCIPAQKRLFAVGRGEKWVEAKNAQWTEIRQRAANEYQATLYADYFCPNRLIVRSREEALRALLQSASRGPAWIH